MCCSISSYSTITDYFFNGQTAEIVSLPLDTMLGNFFSWSPSTRPSNKLFPVSHRVMCLYTDHTHANYFLHTFGCLRRQIYQVTFRPSFNQAVIFQPVISCSSFAVHTSTLNIYREQCFFIKPVGWILHELDNKTLFHWIMLGFLGQTNYYFQLQTQSSSREENWPEKNISD